MSFTYAELKTAIQDFTENNEPSFVRNIPLFIRQAEERILKNVQLDLFRQNATGQMSAGNQYLEVPNDFLAPFSLSYANNPTGVGSNYMDYKDASFVREYQGEDGVTGKPRYYAQFNEDNFILAPKPDSNYSVQLSYFYRPISLTAGAESGTTWLSKNAEMAMLYGSLIEAGVYMKEEPDIMQMYQSRFQESLMGIKMLGEAKQTTDEYRVGKVVRQKQ